MIQLFASMRMQAESVSIFDTEILDQWEIPFGDWVDQMIDWIDANLSWLLDAIRWPLPFCLKISWTIFCHQFLGYGWS